MDTKKKNDIKAYSRLTQSPAFKNLRITIINHALTKFTLEWDDLCRLTPLNPPKIGDYYYEILQ